MNSLTDPRRNDYFTLVDTSSVPNVQKLAYSGGIYGRSNPFTKYSHINPTISSPTYPGILLSYDEVLFYEAEASARSFSVGDTPNALYNAAITASILAWGGTSDQASAYLSQPGVAYATATGTWQQKIGTQAYFAFYSRGLEGCTEWRRLDWPILNLPPTITDYNLIPKRFTYPIKEQTLNKANYTTTFITLPDFAYITSMPVLLFPAHNFL